MLRDVERCEECGFEYDESSFPMAAERIRAGAADLAAALTGSQADVRARRHPGRWSPLEYVCHVRDMLLVQRERLLAARRLDRPVCEPVGRDERAELDGYADQDPADVARQLLDAAQLFANDLDRLSHSGWDRTVIYTYPHRAERSLRWLAIHTVHEVGHHLLDVRRQLRGQPVLAPAEREERWRLFVRFAIEAASEDEARSVLGQALAGLGPRISLRGEPVIRARYRRTPDNMWVADLEPDLTHLQEIDPDDAKTRCSFVVGHFPVGVTWAAPRNTWREAKREWPPDIWQRQPGHDEVLLHPAVRAVMIYCAAADSPGAGYTKDHQAPPAE
jgi:hypothetical protein